MPIIDGKKMSCRPCITGHRSTKCSHGADRQLFEVRKPGRPLSACPHLSDQLCGCVSVISAIPKKSRCGCGTPSPAVPVAQPLASTVPNPPSPGKVAFKVKKTLSRPASRRQSRDVNGIDIDNANAQIPFQPPRPQVIAPAPSNDMNIASTQNLLQRNMYMSMGTNGYSNGTLSNASLPFQPYVMMQPVSSSNGNGVMADMNGAMTNGQYPNFQTMNGVSSMIPGMGEIGVNGNQYHTNTASDVGFYSSPIPLMPATESSMNGSPAISSRVNGLSLSEKLNIELAGHSDANGVSFAETLENQLAGVSQANVILFRGKLENGLDGPSHQIMYSKDIQQPTFFQYPASYGSPQRPLQMNEWVQGHLSQIYAQPSMQNRLADPVSTNGGSGLETVHECSCGDGCQCEGCPAHPFNETTMESVQKTREAFQNEEFTPSTGEFDFSNSSPGAKSEVRNSEEQSPSDNGNTEEMNLRSEDFIWTEYNFGGIDTCGLNCQCDNCFHNRPIDFNALLDAAINDGPNHIPDQDLFGGNGVPVMTNGIEAVQDSGEGLVKSCCG